MIHSPPKPGRLSQAIRRLYPVYGYYRRLCALADQMSESERRTYQAEQIEKLEGLAKAAGIEIAPLLTNREVQSRPEAFLRKTWWPVVKATTGGTTGRPLMLERSLNSVIFEQAMLDHVFALHGVDLRRSRLAHIRGEHVKNPDDMEPPYSVGGGPEMQIFSGLHLSDKTARAYLAEVAAYRPDVLFFYPSTLEIFLRLAREARMVFRPKLVMTSSMVLPEELFGAVAEAFQCPLLDWYGQGERACVAWASEARQYRFRPEYGKVHLALPQARGVVGATGFHNRRQIFFNYSMGDLLLGAKDLSDSDLRAIELGMKPFAGIEGRQNDVLILSDGRQYAALHQTGFYVHGADYVQMLRVGIDAIEISIVKNHHYTEATKAMIHSNLTERLPSSLKILYRFAEAPVRTATGKTPNYIDLFSPAKPSNQ